MNIFRHYFNLAKFAQRGEEGFYNAREYLAVDLISELEEFVDLKGKKVLDVGGERGEFAKILAEKRKCQAVNLEPKKSALGEFVWKTVIGSADKLPFKNESFDIVLLRGVIQHIPTDKKLKSLQEIYRVLKKGGIAYVMIPPWYNPLSGQNIKPFQYFPYKMARHFRNSVFNSGITANYVNALGIWPMTFVRTQKLILQANFKILKTTDILFKIHFITKIPFLREFLLPSVGFILAKNIKLR